MLDAALTSIGRLDRRDRFRDMPGNSNLQFLRFLNDCEIGSARQAVMHFNEISALLFSFSDGRARLFRGIHFYMCPTHMRPGRQSPGWQ